MYYIVFPRGDKRKLSIINLSDSCSYELSDYSVASRKSFIDDDSEGAITYAKQLAKTHNLILDSNCDEIAKELNYLD